MFCDQEVLTKIQFSSSSVQLKNIADFKLVSYLNMSFGIGMSSRLSPRVHLHVVGMSRFMSVTNTNRACPLLFILFLCLFLSLWPFQLYFIP